jgi:AcrR family transcriptional regulator
MKTSKRPPPRDRILAAADRLFCSQGIRGVGVDGIAEAAGTNKMALYRHFASKDELVAEWLRIRIEEFERSWGEFDAKYRDEPLAQLRASVRLFAQYVAHHGDRGCPFGNSLSELPDRDHPARRLVEAHKQRKRERFIGLFRAGGAADPKRAADELFFLFEGAQMSAQSLGPANAARRVVELAEELIAKSAVPTKTATRKPSRSASSSSVGRAAQQRAR